MFETADISPIHDSYLTPRDTCTLRENITSKNIILQFRPDRERVKIEI